MSNAFKSYTENITPAQFENNQIAQSRMEWVDQPLHDKTVVLVKTPECAHKELNSKGELDIEMRPTILIPEGLTLDVELEKKPIHKRFASTVSMKVGPRLRSLPALQIVGKVVGLLPENPSRKLAFARRDAVVDAIKSKISVRGGSTYTLGRLRDNLPRKGAVVSRPITREEAVTAIRRSGQSLDNVPVQLLNPFPIVSTEDTQGIKVNVKAESGFPVLASWDSPGAPEMIMGLALGALEDLKVAYRADKVNGVWNQIREWEHTKPWLVACRGKCKADYYSQQKIENLQMRFYNAVPRQMMLLMQQATQVLEEQSRNLLMQVDGTSAQGLSLVRGGASDLVDALDVQLMMKGFAYAHVGDDTLCAVVGYGMIIIFSLDCSSFDLTQHADATEEVHKGLRDELAKVDPVAAQLWYAYMRERLVVTHRNMVYHFRHAGPSGMPMQSKVNDVIMEVVCTRLFEHPEVVADKEALDRRLQEIGRELHLKIRLEDYEAVKGARTLREALEEVSFLFIGYRFYAENKNVYVFADLPRSMAQFPFPSGTWEKKQHTFEAKEAMRVGSIIMNMGRPPQGLRHVFEVLKANAVALLDNAIAEFGDIDDPSLKWACQNNPYGAAAQPSMVGLREALTNMEGLWSCTQEEVELPGTSVMLTDWASMMDEQDKEDAAKAGRRYVPRPGADVRLMSLKKLRVRAKAVATHPATIANLGRPAPTAVWGPDKPKRDITEPALRRRGGGRTARTDQTFYDDESESGWEQESDDREYDDYYQE